MKNITAIELNERLSASEAITVLDVREPYEVEICAIEGLKIPMGEVADRVNEIDATKPVVVVCRSGRRAEPVANLLATEHGFTDVSILDGGIMAWIEQVDNSLEAY